MITSTDTYLEKYHTSTRLKRTKRVMDKIYLYLFGFNFDTQYAHLHWKPGISQDIGKIGIYIRYGSITALLNLVLLYVKIRGEHNIQKPEGLKKIRERKAIHRILQWIEKL